MLLGLPWRGPSIVPTGTVDAAERVTFLNYYSGIALAGSTAPAATTGGRLPVRLQLARPGASALDLLKPLFPTIKALEVPPPQDVEPEAEVAIGVRIRPRGADARGISGAHPILARILSSVSTIIYAVAGARFDGYSDAEHAAIAVTRAMLEAERMRRATVDDDEAALALLGIRL